jgi:RND family efflux transporter MFP subunit
MSAGHPIAEHLPRAPKPAPHAPWRALVAALVIAALIAAGVVLARRVRPQAEPQNAPTMAGMPGMTEGSMPPAPAGASSSAVFISPAKQQLIGVRTGVVERQRAEGTTRTVGVLAYDETRTTHVHVKVAGWVEKLFVDFTGKPVRRGQPLFSVYSPDLVTAQSDYLVALRARKELSGSSMSSAVAASDALVNAARDRLRRWDVTDAEIAQLEADGKPTKTVTLYSPFDGVVLERTTYAGQYVTPEMDTFKLGDLSTIWVLGQAFELDAPRVRVGAPIDVELTNMPGAKASSATVDFVFPGIDPQTRRIRFRANLLNPGQRLKPDTYVTVVLHGEPVDRLMVPREAVIDTGVRTYVLVALPNGYFDPRDVKVGPAVGESYPVVEGLAEGERVVTSAQFLVDSETNLMAAMQNMSMTMPGMDMGGMNMPKPAPSASGSSMPAMPGMPEMSATPAPPAPAPAPSPSSAPPAHHHHPGMPGM